MLNPETIVNMWAKNESMAKIMVHSINPDYVGVERYLHHYCLSARNANPLHLKDSNFVILLNKPYAVQKVLYATTEDYCNSDLANQMLSLTYFPKYNSTIEIENVNDRKTDFMMVTNHLSYLGIDNLPNAPRVWPAFGKTGGSREVIIKTKIDGNTPMLDVCTVKDLPNGGATELWHQDTVYNYDTVLAQRIAEGIIDAFNHSEEDFLGRENPGLIVKGTPSGVVFNAPLRKSEKNLTISIAWKNLDAQPEFKFWACLWRDDLDFSIRFMLDAFTDSLVLTAFPSDKDPREAIKEDLEHHGPIYYSVRSITRSLIKRAVSVDKGFFMHHCIKIRIP